MLHEDYQSSKLGKKMIEKHVSKINIRHVIITVKLNKQNYKRCKQNIQEMVNFYTKFWQEKDSPPSQDVSSGLKTHIKKGKETHNMLSTDT